MDSGMFGLQVIMVVPHVQELSGFRATMTAGTAVIAIMLDTGVKFVDSGFQERARRASKAFVLVSAFRAALDVLSLVETPQSGPAS